MEQVITQDKNLSDLIMIIIKIQFLNIFIELNEFYIFIKKKNF